MDQLLITGGNPLIGEVQITGAKNAVLPILMASLMTNEPVILKNIPHLSDVTSSLQLLASLGVSRRLEYYGELSFELHSKNLISNTPNIDLVQSMRASIMLLGPLLSRLGEVKLYHPGGCVIGGRPINLHIDGLKQMGAEIEEKDNFIIAKATKLYGTSITFPIVSVTGTENILTAAVLAEGQSIINNAALEPEVTDLANCLVQMGAKISGIGTNRLIVTGVKKLHGTTYRVMADRIEAGTYLVAGAMTRGKVKVSSVEPNSLTAVIDKLKETGVKVSVGSDWIEVDALNIKHLNAVNIKTAPFPGFPTDMQAQIVALNCIAKGNSTVEETVFESRFHHVNELRKMQANLTIENNKVHIKSSQLKAAITTASDLRASASLVLAALVANGKSTIQKVQHIDRGYELIEEKLIKLGANIYRVHNENLEKKKLS